MYFKSNKYLKIHLNNEIILSKQSEEDFCIPGLF